jgi:putative nucleotidyltransferase with HDIG domain
MVKYNELINNCCFGKSNIMEKNYFEEFTTHLLEDETPSKYFNELYDKDNFPEEYPFSLITDLKKVEQSPKHHPEGNVWNHTMEVLDVAAQKKEQSSDTKAFMWAALLHDLGKITKTKVRKGRITAYDHDIEGEAMAKEFLELCGETTEFIKKVSALVRWHMQILFVVKDMPYQNIDGMKNEVSLNDVGLLGFCDRLGRNNLTMENIKTEEKNIKVFLNKCHNHQLIKNK